jgi:predicted DNA-binding protein (UPF0251 family)
MIQTNIKKLFEDAGLEAIRPTDEALAQMGISRRRFTLLLENSQYATPMSVHELEAIRIWIEGIKSIDAEQIVGNYSPSSDMAKELGLTK